MTKEESRKLVACMSKAHGFDDLASALTGILYFEPEPVPLDYLVKESGYSLASVSNAVRILERAQMITRSRKAKSKKVYCFMDKDLMKMHQRIFERKHETIGSAERQVERLIKKSKGEHQKLLVGYYHHMHKMKLLMEKMEEWMHQ